MTDKVRNIFQETVREGEQRIERSLSSLLSTGLVGGIDVGIGVLALFLVLHATGQVLVAALAFGIGFVALSLAQSELFTENFLVPLSAVAARRARVRGVLRLWSGTLAMNLAGGWLMMGVVVSALPALRAVALEVGSHYPRLGITWRSFSLAILGGAIITLMTWMEHSTRSVPARLVAAISAAFLLAAGEMNHVIVASLQMFSALQVGAPFGYADWLGATAWAAVGNVVGGIGLVTMLRFGQVGRRRMAEAGG